jgi:hypothetical protein
MNNSQPTNQTNNNNKKQKKKTSQSFKNATKAVYVKILKKDCCKQIRTGDNR